MVTSNSIFSTSTLRPATTTVTAGPPETNPCFRMGHRLLLLPPTPTTRFRYGHFKFNFLNLDAPPSDDNGNGWAAGDESLFPDGTPTFAPPAYTDDPIPEPGTSALLGAGLLALALLSRRNYFSRSSRS